ncbi:putative RNA helicase [Lobaria immixta]|nr:putative RNA helicase [Lobaria immixta]
MPPNHESQEVRAAQILEHGKNQIRESSPSKNSSSASNASSGDSDSGKSYIETHSSRTRKRRRLSPEADLSLSDDPYPPTLPVSRIKPRVSSTSVKASAALEIPTLSNGKVVDGSASFASLGVSPWLLASLSAMAIKRPTAIQKGCIPAILEGRDVIGGSKTGSGKTVAFTVPMLQRWAQDPVGIFAVILTPTRELALQILEQIKAISAPQTLKPILVTGGSEMRPQALALSQRPHVVIATPGRLADHILNSGKDTTGGLRRTQIVVLDEADRLLASGPGSMLSDVETCLSALPPSHARQTCLFTATLTPEVMALKSLPRGKDQPPIYVCEVDTSDLAVPPTLHQTYLQVPLTYREAYLHILLFTARNAVKQSIIIFCNRTATANLLERLLRLLDHRVTSLHSLLPQYDRASNLAKFRASAARILVATDVASRGLDIPTVELVINYDVPRNPDDYVHRVGRTARAGREGEAITMVGQRDVALFLAIEARVGQKMGAFEEKGVNIETRVIRDGLKEVGERKREALLAIEEGRDVKGNRIRGKVRRLE